MNDVGGKDTPAPINVRLGPLHWPARTWQIWSLPFVLFLLIPLVAIVLRVSPADFLTNLNRAQVYQAVRLSLVTSLVTVAASILFGTPVAYLVSHRHYRVARWVDILVDLPTVLPPAVAGVALLVAFGRRGLLGGVLSNFGLSIPFTTLAVIMAQTFIAAPLYIKSAALGFTAVDCELRKAAALDGANRWQTFRFIMAPMAARALISGAIMTWARAMGEFGATIIFAGNFPGRTQTMPLAIYLGFELDLQVALTLSVILIGLSFLTIVLVKGWSNKHLSESSPDFD